MVAILLLVQVAGLVSRFAGGCLQILDGCLQLLYWLSEVYLLLFVAGFSVAAWVGVWGWVVFLAMLWLGCSAEGYVVFVVLCSWRCYGYLITDACK